MKLSSLTTSRLLLRPWRPEDLDPFAKLNADARVMEYFPAILNRQESDQLAKKIQKKLEEKGWGFWAAVEIQSQKFIGFIGLNELKEEGFPFEPAVEIGWRLAFDDWGRGYATEGALAALKYGFETLKLDEIVSFTAVQNERSQKVMKKIGMHCNRDEDFDHPKIAKGDKLQRHVLYRIKQGE